MKAKNIFFMLICGMIFLNGCQSKNEQLYKGFTKDSDNLIKNIPAGIYDDNSANDADCMNEEVSGELKIYMMNSQFYEYNSWLYKEFNKRYPNVKLSYVGPEMYDIYGYTSKTSVELMSESGVDIIDLMNLPYTQLAKNNFLEDLYPYMERDLSFHKEDYYTNIFKAMEYKNKMYCIPLGFSYRCVCLSKPLLEAHDIDLSVFHTINYKNILDIYHDVAAANNNLMITHFWNKLIFENDEYIGYYITASESTRFNSPDFINFLKDMKSIQWPTEEELSNLNFIPLYESNLTNDSLATYNDDLCYFISSNYHDERNAKQLLEHINNLTNPIPTSASNGDKPFNVPDPTLAIVSTSKNKDLAWLFIHFCMEERSIEKLDLGGNWYITGYPINRKNTLKMLGKAFGPGNEEDIAKIDAWNAERDCTYMTSYDTELYPEIEEIADDFYAGRISAEECAKQIQERVDIYLKE